MSTPKQALTMRVTKAMISNILSIALGCFAIAELKEVILVLQVGLVIMGIYFFFMHESSFVQRLIPAAIFIGTALAALEFHQAQAVSKLLHDGRQVFMVAEIATTAFLVLIFDDQQVRS